MGKSDAYALKIVGNDLWQDVGRHFLTSTLHWWVGRLSYVFTVSFRPVSEEA